MRRGSIASLIGIGVVAGGIAAAAAVALPWLPTPASREAGRIDFVFWFVVAICILIFAVVVAALLYAVIHFRVRPDDDSDGPPVHGHTGLEITWTLIPTLLVTAIGIASAIVLARDDALGENVLRVDVTAQQFAWSFSYPGFKGLTSPTLRLPKDRSVLLRFTSKDVIHSFWVPEFSQKQDAVPGLHPTLHITPDRVGTFPVVCSELCGLGHAVMRSQAIVMPPPAFDRWVRAQTTATTPATTTTASAPATTTTPATTGNASASGSAVFKANGCGACHALAAAGSSATVGPDLDKLPQYARQAHRPLAAFVRRSIVAPDAYVQPHYSKGIMPHTFGKTLSKPQLDALVQYLVNSGKKG
ncbi:MAG: cytochrome c oxidase subunit [Actinomycetota bacterium]